MQIVSPAQHAKISLPVRLAWKTKNFKVVERSTSERTDRGYFGIFVDRAPQPPGEHIEWFFERESSCEPVTICLTPDRLAAEGIFTARRASFVFADISRRPDAARGQQDFHDVTVVLLDPGGRRIGESGDTVFFRLDRDPR